MCLTPTSGNWHARTIQEEMLAVCILSAVKCHVTPTLSADVCCLARQCKRKSLLRFFFCLRCLSAAGRLLPPPLSRLCGRGGGHGAKLGPRICVKSTWSRNRCRTAIGLCLHPSS